MICFHSTWNQVDIKRQLRQILDWEMDCNIDIIAFSPKGMRQFTIRTKHGSFYTVIIQYYENNRVFVTATLDR